MQTETDRWQGLVEASMRRLPNSYEVRFEEEGGVGSYRLRGEGRDYRVIFGEELRIERFRNERLIVLSWGAKPFAFVNVPNVRVTYFDLRFQIHSMRLDGVARRLESCLKEEGCAFRDFEPSAPSPRRKGGPASFLGRLGALRRRSPRE